MPTPRSDLGPLVISPDRPPFSFLYDGQRSEDLLGKWKHETGTPPPATKPAARTTQPASAPPRPAAPRADGGRVTETHWTDPRTGLRVTATVTQFADFPAVEWLLRLENPGTEPTPIIDELLALDCTLAAPLPHSPAAPATTPAYRLHRTNGAPSNPGDFEPSVVPLNGGDRVGMAGGGGRSSNRDFPFYKLEVAGGAIIVAVGWSGQWRAELACDGERRLRLTAGLEAAHFRLLPGEHVRTARILLFWHAGDVWECNARFRLLMESRYVRLRGGRPSLPVLFSNTCFTRKGGWLNECNAENQISLIRAYAPLGLEAVITDAGWFEGGWPAGAGNWTPRRDAYPAGFGPVAAAAKDRGMAYGLWFEPERVVAGTPLDKDRPEWVLRSGAAPDSDQFKFAAGLLNFALPAVREHFLDIVGGFMKLPGFRVYRQDFNFDPLPFWQHNDAPDRRGITEMHYIEGLYAYWDEIASRWPDALMEECASGGRRIDLETVLRFHLHQESDWWFDNEADQGQVWGLSQYLPNSVFDTPIDRLDTYTFHSCFATSLIIGWIADAPEFDLERAKKLLARYRELRHLLVGTWYPLLPYSRAPEACLAMQFHRPDLDAGLVLAFRHGQSPDDQQDLALHGLDEKSEYELTWDVAGRTTRARGADLARGLKVAITAKPASELIAYRRVGG